MTRSWSLRHLLILFIAYTAAACVGTVVYASSQVLLERAHPTKAIAPTSEHGAQVAWVPMVRRPGGSICVLGKDERSTCLRPSAGQAEIDKFIVDMEHVVSDYRECAQQENNVSGEHNK